MDLELVTIIVALPFFFFILFLWAYRKEKQDWNDGECPYCKTPWILFDKDSQGGRGYACHQRHVIWISYPVDKHHE